MFKTIHEFWLRWRLRVAEERIKTNTRIRKSLIKNHAEQTAKYERIQEKLKAFQ